MGVEQRKSRPRSNSSDLSSPSNNTSSSSSTSTTNRTQQAPSSLNSSSSGTSKPSSSNTTSPVRKSKRPSVGTAHTSNSNKPSSSQTGHCTSSSSVSSSRTAAPQQRRMISTSSNNRSVSGGGGGGGSQLNTSSSRGPLHYLSHAFRTTFSTSTSTSRSSLSKPTSPKSSGMTTSQTTQQQQQQQENKQQLQYLSQKVKQRQKEDSISNKQLLQPLTTATTTSSSKSHESSAALAAAASRNKWMALVYGQGLALLVASCNASSFMLSFQYGVQTEFFQMFLFYLILTFHLTKNNNQTPTTTSKDNNTTTIKRVDSKDRGSNNPLDLQTSPSSLAATVNDDLNCSMESQGGEEESTTTSLLSASSSPSSSSSASTYTLPCTDRIQLRIRWWIYLIYSFLDVAPNVMTLLSFRYTSLTSTTLLGSLMAPSCMFFSSRLLGQTFRRQHYVGVALTVLGGCLTVWSDVDTNPTTAAVDSAAAVVASTTLAYSADMTRQATIDGMDPAVAAVVVDTPLLSAAESVIARPYSWVGDLLAIGAALVYGLGDVLAEFSIKNVDKDEYLGMLGFFGTILTGIMFPLIEREAVHDLFIRETWTETFHVMAVLLWYVFSCVGYYIGLGVFLEASDATLLNLSLQAANLWVVFFSWAVYSQLPPTAFFFAFVFVSAGVYEYEIRGRAAMEEEAAALAAASGDTVEFSATKTLSSDPPPKSSDHSGDSNEEMSSNHGNDSEEDGDDDQEFRQLLTVMKPPTQKEEGGSIEMMYARAAAALK